MDRNRNAPRPDVVAVDVDDPPRGCRDTLIERYRSYVEGVVASVMRSMRLPESMRDDFVAAGYLGLVESAARYDAATGVDFRHFAFWRIRGAVIDTVRTSAHVQGKALRQLRALEAMQGGADQTSAPTAGLSTEERLARVLDRAARGMILFRLGTAEAEEALAQMPTSTRSPEDGAIRNQELRILCELIATLPPKQRLVIEAHYFRGRSFAQIARDHDGLSKSWVSRLHARAIDKLKERYLCRTNGELRAGARDQPCTRSERPRTRRSENE